MRGHVEVVRALLVAGADRGKRNRQGEAQGVSLTGWMAMLGMTAMIVLIFYGLFAGYKRMRGVPDKDYTLVVKSQPK